MLVHSEQYEKKLEIRDFAAEISTIELPSKHVYRFEGKEHHIEYGLGFLLLSLIGVSFLAVIFAFYRRRFLLLVNVFFNWKLSKQIIRYEKVHSHPVNILLLITFTLFFPMFYSLSLNILRPELEFSMLLKSISLFILIYFIGKYVLYQFSAWLFEEKELFNQYIFQLNLYTKLMGVLLLILWIFLIYAPISAKILFDISLAILLVFLALQTYIGFAIGRSEGKHLLLIILYLCTLEILPWLLIYKGLENNW